MASDTQPIVMPLPFELLDVSGKFLLQEVQAIAEVPPQIFGKGSKLLAGFFGEKQLIGHIPVYPAKDLRQVVTFPVPTANPVEVQERDWFFRRRRTIPAGIILRESGIG